MPLNIEVGDIVTTKKQHPCGSHEFKINRVGMDFRIKCLKCEKEIWITRSKFEKRIRKIVRNNEEVDFKK